VVCCKSTAVPASGGLTARGDIVLAACWAHALRKSYDLHDATGSPIAAEALRRIAEPCAIESRRFGGLTALSRSPAMAPPRTAGRRGR
jgi:hypothetical protein